ncbi:hypothetical protein C8R46DRAFT_1061568 [Mycena filopes]|nr:hypothetical protein C8R46DRAFT_1061568 [Mycena filopes]
MSAKAKFSKLENTRGDDTPLFLNIPPPYSLHDNALLPEPEKPRVVRPLPPAPRQDSPAPPRRLPRRRASGGSFVHATGAPPPSPAKKPQVFFVANPGDSPISPYQPNFPNSQHQPFGLNITPPTPLPPRTPGLVRSMTQPVPLLNSNSAMRDPFSPEDTTAAPWRSPRKRRRFAGSVGSIPANVLADLRKLGDREDSPRADTLPVPRMSESQSDDDEDDFDEEELGDTWVIQKATRVVGRTRTSLRWVEELGTDRWIAEDYSNILQAL